jgi:hypothetical protein
MGSLTRQSHGAPELDTINLVALGCINSFKLGGESLTMHCSRRPSAAAECWTLGSLSGALRSPGRWCRGAAIGGVALRLLSGGRRRLVC